MKVVFIGAVKLSKLALEDCISQGVNVAGVIAFRASAVNSDFEDLGLIAKINNIPFIYTSDVNSNTTKQWIEEIKPDLILCIGISKLLKEDIFKIPRNGTIGFHPSRLPQNRGRHPLIWALALGLTETATTFFYINSGTDTGDIISQRTVKIEYEDNAYSLYKKVCQTAIRQLRDILQDLRNGIITRIPQDSSNGNYWRKRTNSDGLIDFRMTSSAIYNLVRALSTPYPGAYVLRDKREMRVWRVNEVQCGLPNIEPGKVLSVNENGILVKCSGGCILICEHEIIPVPKPGEYFQ